MPVNKNAYLRYQILDQCFSDKHRRYNIQDLIDIVSDKLGYNISLRQIREDIFNLRLGPYYAQIDAIKYDGKKCYYRYHDPNFSIFDNELTVEEVSSLRSTIDMLKRYRGIPANAWLEEVISNLEYRFGVKPDTEKLVAFEQNEHLKGLEKLSDLIDATVNHQTLSLVYRPYRGAEKHLIVHPYYVKQYNNRWFLFGLNDDNDLVSNFALDRIEQVAHSDKLFRKNTFINFDTYFKDIVGVSVPYHDAKVEHIVLRFSEQRFPYVVSKPIHPSQQVVDDCTVSIDVIPTRELEQQIFSFGADVEVIAPQQFRERIQENVRRNLENYLPMQKGCTRRK